MMKKVISKCLLLTLFFLIVKNVNAASTCDYSEQVRLQTIASNVKASYEANVRQTDEFADIDSINDPNGAYIVERYVEITILNITEDIYVSVETNKSTDVQSYHYQDTDEGTLRILKSNLDEIVEYKILVYSNHEQCTGDLLRTIMVLTPKYNEYSEYGYCDSLPNLFYCQQFITTEITTNPIDVQTEMNRQYQALQKEEEVKRNEDVSFWAKLTQFFKDNLIIISVILGLLVLIGVTTTVIAIKKRRSRVL